MQKLGLNVFISMVLVAAVCVMLAADSHPGMIVLVLGGMSLSCFRVNAIMGRGRARRGEAQDFTFRFADIGELKASDLIELAATVLVSLAMLVIGITLFGRQAP